MMLTAAYVLLLQTLYLVSSERVFQWNQLSLPKLPNTWRVTSFAVTTDYMYLSLVDVNKQAGPNGVVVAFKVESKKSPQVEFYPDETSFKILNPVGGKITTPIAVRADKCNRLWILDAAVSNLSGERVVSSPALHIVDLSNRMIIRTYPIPDTQYSPGSLLANLVIENPASDVQCERVFAYVADTNRPHLIVYDFETNTSHSKQHHYFNPDPLIHVRGDFLYNRPEDTNGVYGMAVVKEEAQPNRLFFHALAGTNEFSIPTAVLHDKQVAIPYTDPDLSLKKKIDTESGSQVYDEMTRTFFQAEINNSRLGCWSYDSFMPRKTAVQSYESLKSIAARGFIQDLAVAERELWMLVRDGTIVEIYKEAVADMVKGTSCEIRTVETRGGPQPPHEAPGPTGSAASVSSTISLIASLVLLTCLHR